MSQQTNSIHILHVDDEPGFADMAATFLEREDERFTIETAPNPDEAMNRLDDNEFDCIVSDYDMPGQNGIEFLEAVREENPDLPFILYTGKGSEEVASDAISAGVTDYLQKESGTSQYTVLENRIKNAVEQYHTQTALTEREQRLNLFFEQSPLGVIEWDDKFKLRRMNDAAEEILGYEQQTLAGESWEAIVPESDREAVHDVVSELLENAGGYLSINENVREDGERIICEWHNRVITDDDGEVVAVFSLFQDITDQQQLKQKREEIIERVTDAIVEVDADWRFTLINKQAEDLYDMAEEDLLGRNFWDVFEAAKDTRFEEEYREVMETRESTSFVEYFTQLDGWFDIEVYPKDDGGIAFYFVEVTEQRKRKEELKQTNTLLSTLFETLPVGVLAEDASRNVLAVNDRLFELFGFPGTPEEVIGADCTEMAEQASDMFVDPDGFVKRINELVANQEPTDNEELTPTDGRTFERSYRPIQLPNEDGHLWVYQDITTRTEREQELSDTKRRLELVLEGTDTGIWEWKIGTGEIEWNNTVEQALGLEPGSFEGTYEAFAKRVHPDDLAQVEEALDQAIETDELYHLEFRMIHEDGGTVWVECPGVVVEQENESDWMVGLYRDITERKRREEQLERFASFVSHDLRNPLSVASGNLELAREDCESEYLDNVENAHNRMDSLIENLLTLAREGNKVGETELVGLADITKNCWENVATAEATLTAETECEIRADRSRLQQLLENLMRNAVEHGGEDVTVTVGRLEDGFYVEDDGPGIPTENRDEVFEAGYSTSEGGTGFGLSIVKQVAEAHDWKIRVTDGSKGGARFEITGVEFAAE